MLLTLLVIISLSFTNYAFYAEKTSITSCARPDLIDCAVKNNSGVDLCEDQLYGNIEESLFNTVGEFIIDRDTWFIFVVKDGDVALDNIKISYTYNASANVSWHDDSSDERRRRRLLSNTTESPTSSTSTTSSYWWYYTDEDTDFAFLSSWNNTDYPIKFGAINGTTLIIDSELDEVECCHGLVRC